MRATRDLTSPSCRIRALGLALAIMALLAVTRPSSAQVVMGGGWGFGGYGLGGWGFSPWGGGWGWPAYSPWAFGYGMPYGGYYGGGWGMPWAGGWYGAGYPYWGYLGSPLLFPGYPTVPADSLAIGITPLAVQSVRLERALAGQMADPVAALAPGRYRIEIRRVSDARDAEGPAPNP